jgi:glycosyltransferase involved in cell wall biosynthesis
MPGIYRDADVVLDQFRLGSYGVAACEAMAAGRVVVGNVTDAVRRRVRETTGSDLPVVQAEPDEIADVVLRLIDERDWGRARAAEGVAFVERVHSGPLAAEALRGFLESGEPDE